MSPEPEGLLLVDKASGPTSHDVVVRVRRALRQPRAGHTGTLDPMATGLLAIALGRATRLIRFLPASPKTYTGTFVLGVATDTDDTTGEAVRRHAGALPRDEEVVAAAARLLGASLQVPPAYSARKIGGERLYDLARRGEAVAAPASEIVVDRFDVRPAGAGGAWAFDASVSAGTYVRGLVRDLGETLGCGAALAALRRTAIGTLGVDAAVPVAATGRLDPAALASRVLPIDAVPLPLPDAVLDDPKAIARFLGGNPADVPPSCRATGPCRVADAGGRLLGVGESNGRAIRPWVVLAGPAAAPSLPGPRSV